MTITILTFDQLPEAKQSHVVDNKSKLMQQTYKDMNLKPDIHKCDEIARDWAEQKKYSAVNGRYYICEIEPI